MGLPAAQMENAGSTRTPGPARKQGHFALRGHAVGQIRSTGVHDRESPVPLTRPAEAQGIARRGFVPAVAVQQEMRPHLQELIDLQRQSRGGQRGGQVAVVVSPNQPQSGPFTDIEGPASAATRYRGPGASTARCRISPEQDQFARGDSD